MCGITAFIDRKADFRLTAMTPSQDSSVVSRNGDDSLIPTLLSEMSILPNVSRQASTTREGTRVGCVCLSRRRCALFASDDGCGLLRALDAMIDAHHRATSRQLDGCGLSVAPARAS